MTNNFHFKQFTIAQDLAAMKVGTDGVLLGAWANVESVHSILDIGSGTGLIALMLAQRNETAEITAIDIEKTAFEQTKQNIENSKWKSRLHAIHLDFNDFVASEKFDLIVSNPPFFNNTFQAENQERNTARQTENLNFETLLSKTASLLSKNGNACFIIPFSEEENFVSIAKKQQLFLNKKLQIKGNINTEIKRSLLSISFQETEIESDILAIEISRHVYTKEYINLVKYFYLKM